MKRMFPVAPCGVEGHSLGYSQKGKIMKDQSRSRRDMLRLLGAAPLIAGAVAQAQAPTPAPAQGAQVPGAGAPQGQGRGVGSPGTELEFAL